MHRTYPDKLFIFIRFMSIFTGNPYIFLLLKNNIWLPVFKNLLCIVPKHRFTKPYIKVNKNKCEKMHLV